ncbi:carbonic anhydrase [Halorussus gelatinilyticus]|uniref:Carbonic anhydrase n=1 Tax=Halorussus gelatinilyticus TaxID=2937524 RepID=A0A8U0IIH6_9EURY|nr:carbonic anhydrase [Halorussus gelatinilyticus]UPW00495.1 carbonic anhydrase [Halorussus gelatinilyticus]
MTNDTLLEFLDREGRSLEPTDSDRESGGGAVVGLVVTCPMAQQTSRQLWPLDPIGAVSNVSRLASQPWKSVEDNRVLTPDIAHLTHRHELETILVVGHSDCDVVADAYDEYVATDQTVPAGVEARVEPLVSVVREAIESGHVETDCPQETLLARLVEYIVTRQVEFLVQSESVTATIAGYVHDDDGVYGGFPDTPYLVSLNGERDVETLRSRVPEGRDVAVASVRS